MRTSGKALFCLRSLIKLTLLLREVFTSLCSSDLTMQSLSSNSQVCLWG